MARVEKDQTATYYYDNKCVPYVTSQAHQSPAAVCPNLRTGRASAAPSERVVFTFLFGHKAETNRSTRKSLFWRLPGSLPCPNLPFSSPRNPAHPPPHTTANGYWSDRTTGRPVVTYAAQVMILTKTISSTRVCIIAMPSPTGGQRTRTAQRWILILRTDGVAIGPR
jgi:hypothetical protein